MLHIGELSRRLGVAVHVLRAWESRYGLLQPVRSAGSFRLYPEADARRIRRMQAHLAHGLSATRSVPPPQRPRQSESRSPRPPSPLLK